MLTPNGVSTFSAPVHLAPVNSNVSPHVPIYVNSPPERQRQLADIFWWLPAVCDGERPHIVRHFSVSAFDHWLSREEARDLLENVSVQEQEARDRRHRVFCEALLESTEVLGFRIYGRRRSKLKFREFSERSGLARRLEVRQKGEFQFAVVIPAWEAAYLSGYDDTSHFFSEGGRGFDQLAQLARSSGLHVLELAG